MMRRSRMRKKKKMKKKTLSQAVDIAIEP